MTFSGLRPTWDTAMLMPSTGFVACGSLLQLRGSDLHISRKTLRTLSGPSACGSRALSCGRWAHRRAQDEHTATRNPHDAHALANPNHAHLHYPVAREHHTRATMHQGYAGIHEALGQSHWAEAHNQPLHFSLHTADVTILHAQWSYEAAWDSYDGAQASGVSHISSS